MAATIAHGMCRCCASEGSYKDFRSVYHWMGEQEVYGDMLQECLDITLSTSENGNNGGICELCITQLRNASNFKKQVLRTEQQFLQMVRDNALKLDVDVKLEHEHKDIFDSQDSDHDVTEEFCAAVEFEAPPIKEEEEIEESDGPKTRKRAAKASTSKAKKAKKEAGETSTKSSTRRLRFTPLNANKSLPEQTKQKRHGRFLSKTADKGKVLSNLSELLLSTNATLIKRCDDFGYVCGYCDNQYFKAADLKTHTLNTHLDVSDSYLNETSSILAVFIKVDITNLQCNLCDSMLDDLSKAYEHLKSVHSKSFFDVTSTVVPFKFLTDSLDCYICGSTFYTFKPLLQHMREHCANYICTVCGSGYVTNAGLRAHMVTHKSGQYPCQHCDKVFQNSQKRATHMRNHVKANYKCGSCDETFNSYSLKLAHLREAHDVGKEGYKCNICDRVFALAKYVQLHKKKDHMKDLRHACLDCGKTFFKTDELQRHRVKHTGEKNYECPVCMKHYGRRSTLRLHLRIHNDDRRFKCSYCEKSFVAKSSLKGHVQTHHRDLF